MHSHKELFPLIFFAVNLYYVGVISLFKKSPNTAPLIIMLGHIVGELVTGAIALRGLSIKKHRDLF
jgi:hypothetical protein